MQPALPPASITQQSSHCTEYGADTRILTLKLLQLCIATNQLSIVKLKLEADWLADFRRNVNRLVCKVNLSPGRHVGRNKPEEIYNKEAFSVVRCAPRTRTHTAGAAQPSTHLSQPGHTDSQHSSFSVNDLQPRYFLVLGPAHASCALDDECCLRIGWRTLPPCVRGQFMLPADWSRSALISLVCVPPLLFSAWLRQALAAR